MASYNMWYCTAQSTDATNQKKTHTAWKITSYVVCGGRGVSINLTSILFEYCMMIVLFTGTRTAINTVFASGPVTANDDVQLLSECMFDKRPRLLKLHETSVTRAIRVLTTSTGKVNKHSATPCAIIAYYSYY